MKNPIPRSGLFATPTLEKLVETIEQMNGAEKANAYTIMMMTLNACNKLVEEQLVETTS
jgi:hypothetical protein